MFEDQLKSEFTDLINRWTSPDFQAQEIRPLITKSEFLGAMQDVLKVAFGINSVFTPITTPQNNTMLLDPHTPTKITDYNYNLPDRYKSLDILPISHCDYRCEEVCKVEDKINTTINIEDPPLSEMEKQLDATNSPIVFINEVGRSDTFELENPNSTKDLADPKMNKTEVFDETSFSNKKLEDMTKKLEKAQNDISRIAKAAVSIAIEIKGIKKQFQDEANQFLVPKRRNSKSPLVAITPIMSRTNIPKLSASMRRKSSSFTTIENKTKIVSSPNRATSTNSLSTRKKSPLSRTVSHEPGDSKGPIKNPRYSHIQSTIPKPSPNRKKFSKEA